MTVHYCMENPCPICSGSMTSTSTVWTSWNIPITRLFYTWREALLVALASGSTLKPRIVRDEGMWKVTTYQQPVSYNL